MALKSFGYDGDSGFETYNVVDKATLNYLEFGENSNKFYTIEIHEAGGKYRLFTEYGRVGVSSRKEVRYPSGLPEAQSEFQKIIKSKEKKGYVKIEIAQATTGSQKGKELIDTTLLKEAPAVTKSKSSLSPQIQSFVKQIYDETGQKLNSLVKGDVNSDGASPLGKLSVNQLDKGRAVLQEIADGLNSKKIVSIDESIPLSNEYYRHIPKAFGRNISKYTLAIDSMEKVNEEMDILKFYEDSLRMGNIIYDTSNLDKQYEALYSDICILDPQSNKYQKIVDYVISSQSRHHGVNLKVKHIYTVSQKKAPKFDSAPGNIKELFHGTRSANMTGILSSYLKLPNQLRGVHITGAMLGGGLYFADQSTKSSQYSCSRFGGSTNSYNTSFMFLCDVSLGKMYEAPQAMNFSNPPNGFHSVKGVEGYTRTYGYGTLLHNEYVVYREAQQKISYIIEFAVDGRF
jgi:poly [ADP-ribose] polymerase